MGKTDVVKAGNNKIVAAAYPWAEEIANSISHGLGWCSVSVGSVLLLVQAVNTGADATAITSYSLYGGSMILLFLAHAVPCDSTSEGQALAENLTTAPFIS